MRNAIRWFLISAVALGGCAPVGQDSESGNNSLEGHATLMRGSHARACDDVALVRVNDATSRMISALPSRPDGFVRALDFRAIEVDPEYARVSRSAPCDRDGHFLLVGLPAGRYYLVARLTWLLGHTLQGGFLIRPVDVFGAVQGIDMNTRNDGYP